MNVHKLVDQFVARVAQAGGSFQQIDQAPWVIELEQKLPQRLPVTFHSLLSRYCFPPFEVDGLAFFANMGSDDEDELGVAIFKDSSIAEATLDNGYIQFARPTDGRYDPICFDATQPQHNREFPIVRLDHEEILTRNRIRVTARLADSFYRFALGVENHTSGVTN